MKSPSPSRTDRGRHSGAAMHTESLRPVPYEQTRWEEGMAEQARRAGRFVGPRNEIDLPLSRVVIETVRNMARQNPALAVADVAQWFGLSERQALSYLKAAGHPT